MYLRCNPQFWAQLDRGGLPSETLKLRIVKERGIDWWC